jgi:hypothetical protein
MAQFFADRIALGSHRAKTPEGYLLCKDIPFARTGFQLYKAKDLGLDGNPDRKVKVYRRYDEVFNPATLASFEGKTVTSPHPPTFLNPDNDSTYYKGHVQNVRQGPKLSDGEHSLLGDIVIKDSRLISQVESNAINELSAGYQCAYEQDPHTPDIYYQVEIRGNHVAVVPSGRAGSSVKILDAKEEAVTEVATPVVDDKVSVGALTGLLQLLGWGRRNTVDSESEAVERNEKITKEAKERAVARNKDEGKEELEREEKGAAAPKDKKTTKDGGDDDEKPSKKMVDAIRSAVKDALDEYKEEEKEKKEKDAKDAEEKKEKEKKEEAEDADLIPTHEVGAENKPKNPIPGADKALDSLRGMKERIADSGDPELVKQYNDTVRSLKKVTTDNSSEGYRALLSTSSKDVKRATELATVGVRDASEAGESFEIMAERFRGKNPSEVAAELAAEARNKGGK